MVKSDELGFLHRCPAEQCKIHSKSTLTHGYLFVSGFLFWERSLGEHGKSFGGMDRDVPLLDHLLGFMDHARGDVHGSGVVVAGLTLW